MIQTELVKGVVIYTSDDPAGFAKKFWDTYNFDYDLRSVSGNSFFAWPLEGTVEELIEVLMDNGITAIVSERRI